MHPQLRILDFQLRTEAGMGSSALDLHPIRQAASGGTRTIPLLFSLGLTPLLIYGLSISLASHSSQQAFSRANEQTGRSVTLLLQEPTPPPASGFPAVAHSGYLGHREGTDTLDPRLAKLSVATQPAPAEASDPEALSDSPRAARVELSLSPGLPLEAGGTGLARGRGQDRNPGAGGIRTQPRAPIHDLQLVPVREVPVFHRLTRGEETPAQQPVRVRVLIGDDGVPFQATVVSGPAFLHEEALKAARGWRFEPLEPHGLKAPQSVTLKFFPVFQR